MAKRKNIRVVSLPVELTGSSAPELWPAVAPLEDWRPMVGVFREWARKAKPGTQITITVESWPLKEWKSLPEAH